MGVSLAAELSFETSLNPSHTRRRRQFAPEGRTAPALLFFLFLVPLRSRSSAWPGGTGAAGTSGWALRSAAAALRSGTTAGQEKKQKKNRSGASTFECVCGADRSGWTQPEPLDKCWQRRMMSSFCAASVNHWDITHTRHNTAGYRECVCVCVCRSGWWWWWGGGCWHVNCQIQSTMKPDQTFNEIKSAMHQIQQNLCLIIQGTCKFRILLKINCHDFTDDCANF